MFKFHNTPEREYTDDELFASLYTDKLPLTADDIRKARNGDGKALYENGIEYYFYYNYSRALAWFRRAAAQNYSQAQSDIGWMYQRGEGVPKDYKMAMEWFLKSVNNNGNPSAQNSIGEFYHNGLGVPKNIHTATEWYTKAANQVYLTVQYNLGQVYEKEEEVKDLKKAVHWYTLATDNGHKDAKIGLKRLNKKGYYSEEETKEKREMKSNNIETKNASLLDLNNLKGKGKDSGSSNTNEEKQSISAVYNDKQDKVKILEEKIKSLQEEVKSNLSFTEREETYKKDKKKKMIEQAIIDIEVNRNEIKPMEKELHQSKAAGDDDCYNDINYDSSDNENNEFA